MSALLLLSLFGCKRVVLDLQKQRNDNAAKIATQAPFVPSEKLKTPLLLKDVIDIGLEHNPNLNVQKQELEIVKRESVIARLQKLPKLKAGYQKQRRSNYRKQKFLNPDTGVEILSNTVSELRTTETADLVLSWDLLNLGLSHFRSRQARMRHLMMEMQKWRKKQQLVLDITKSYWEAAVSEDALDYLAKTESDLDRQRIVIEKSVAEKRIEALSAKEAQKRLVDLSLSIHQLQIDVSNSKLLLSQFMGVHPNQSFTLKRMPIKPILAAMPRPEQLHLKKMEAIALKFRPELYESDLQILISHDDVRATMLSLFPSINLSAGTYFDDNRLLENNKWSNVGYSLTWGLLDIPSLMLQLKNRKKMVNIKEAERMAVSMSVITQVHLAMLDYANKVKRFKIIEESSNLASEILQMTREQYKVGKTTEYTLARRMMEDVSEKLKKDRAVIEMMVAFKRLLLTIGVMPNIEQEAFKELNIFQKKPEVKKTGVK